MGKEPEKTYWSENDRKDQEVRRQINAGRTYTDDTRCEWCGALLNGYIFECTLCKALLCPQHSCADGCCPQHTGTGIQGVRED
jgi:hypothetical protein